MKTVKKRGQKPRHGVILEMLFVCGECCSRSKPRRARLYRKPSRSAFKILGPEE